MLDTIEIEKSHCRADYRAAGAQNGSGDALRLQCGRSQESRARHDTDRRQNSSHNVHAGEICLTHGLLQVSRNSLDEEIFRPFIQKNR